MVEIEGSEPVTGATPLGTVAARLLDAVASARQPSPTDLRAAEALFLEATRAFAATVASLHGDSRPLPRHSAGVALAAAAIAEALSPSGTLAGRAFVAGLFHDVGKLKIPDTILAKPDRLSAAETEHMKAHVHLGHSLLVRCGGLPDEVAETALRHHEYLDGSGYPDGLAGDAIPLVVRIVTVADVFIALTEPRPYRLAQSNAAAIAVLRSMGDKVDQRVVDSLAGLCAAR